ncbi:hypothetical protein MCAP1_000242 [Malassezia caprae]|uniref:Uncharacterized protein n=1 Tax=Malassezia caprae TaxID=1381934 RepID=A0AAF0E3S1_9BASI|nr:hypothetical protein MCAP1_000242 [Malassezia caprae]
MLTRQAGAKALALGTSAKKDTSAPAGPKRALSTLAKQEHARRMLMSNFVRGEVVGTLSISSEETEVSVVPTQDSSTETMSQDTHDASSSNGTGKDDAQKHLKKKRKRDSDDSSPRSSEKRGKSDKSDRKEKKKEKRDKREKRDKEKRVKEKREKKKHEKNKRDKKEKRDKERRDKKERRN